ncbi:hypothetical protein TFLX_01992 [Thermoflexales bacterium]|nr:hypothetical protein TFLX_01992 [Thermoflexales bacterium]
MSQDPDWEALFERQMQKRRFVAELLLTSELHWEAARPDTLMHFLEQYTLHDSYWIGVWIDPLEEEAILAFEWDTFWAQGRVPDPTDQVISWPTLLIRLNKLVMYYYDKQDQFKDGSTYIGAAETQTITLEEREQLLTCFSGNLQLASSGTEFLFSEDLVHTTISGDMGRWHFLHNSQVDLLCLGEDGQPIPIPGV